MILTYLADDLSPLGEFVVLFSKERREIGDFAASFAPRPKLRRYAIELFPPCVEIDRVRFCKSRNFKIPVEYGRILAKINGANAFGLELAGIPGYERALAESDQIDHEQLEAAPKPLNILSLHLKRLRKFRRAEVAPLFLFGTGLPLTDPVGYFLDPNGSVHAYQAEKPQLGSWPSIAEFFRAEIQRNHDLYIEFEDEWQQSASYGI